LAELTKKGGRNFFIKTGMVHTEKKIKELQKPVILALETATMSGSVALISENKCLAEFTLQTGETHSRRLLAGIDWLLQETGIEWPTIAAVAVSLGPGSFTGLRIGLATAKGLILAREAKLIGVGTLDGLAAQLFAAGDILICPVLDARKKEVYCGFYRCNNRGIPKLLKEYLAISPEDLCHMIDEPVVLLGDGASVYGDFFREKLGNLLTILPASAYFPRAATIGLLALDKWQKNEFLDPAGAEPLYIRPSEAELNLGK
jgi:tRNA threonylcarbamoyladenosine biosynthesis protein TsaB